MLTRLVVATAVAAAAVTCVVVGRQSGAQEAAHRAAGAQATRSSIAQQGAGPSAAPHRGAPARTRPVERHVRPRAVRVARNPCAHNGERKEVLVSLADQRTWLCAGHRMRAAFAVTTGRSTGGDATPTGRYAVQALTRDTVLNPDTGGAYHVKYWIPFKWGMFGFHDAPWQTIPFGSAAFRTQGSLGCVHIRSQDIARLFAWVRLGTTVRVVAGSLR